jgi:hypothetical protein
MVSSGSAMVKPHDSIVLGSANLIHSGFHPNGSSNIASRHRQEAIAVTARCTPRKSQARHYPPYMERPNKSAWKEH